ncbi:MAG: hypothetical protein NT129_01800 [Candidatus Aenigmarchaeota archaeon]|nr:hypothetical protein [Candidatus Aenigmarchaeota archaeon]
MAGLLKEFVDIPWTLVETVYTTALTPINAYNMNNNNTYSPKYDPLAILPKQFNKVDTFARVHLKNPAMVVVGTVGTAFDIITTPLYLWRQIEGRWVQTKETFNGKYPIDVDYLPTGRQGLVREIFDIPASIIDTTISSWKAICNATDLNLHDSYSPKHDALISLPKQFNRADTDARRRFKYPAIAVVGAVGTVADGLATVGHVLRECKHVYDNAKKGLSSSFPNEDDFKPRPASKVVVEVKDYTVR